MNPWPIAAACLLGAAFIAGWSAHRRLWWPLIALSVLMAIIGLQLYTAFRGQTGYHDLAALRAMNATVVPALAGTVIGILIGERMGQGLNWRSWQGAVTVLSLFAGLGSVVGAMMV